MAVRQSNKLHMAREFHLIGNNSVFFIIRLPLMSLLVKKEKRHVKIVVGMIFGSIGAQNPGALQAWF